jgi:bifunctional DNA-binding transcriptional regulator/antitoxin component of YhaV-PrlF toxin-antitoxin module
MKEEKLTIAPQIVKMTSKGQLTLPVEFRRVLKLEKGSYLLMSRLGGKYLLIQKIETSPLDMITEIFGKDVKKKGLTKKDLEKTIEEVREQMWKEGYEKKV